jgi:hypothetical protein
MPADTGYEKFEVKAQKKDDGGYDCKQDEKNN